MKKTKIEWCDSTWNPVTGCLHGCEYCYARRIAERFEPHGGRVPAELWAEWDIASREQPGVRVLHKPVVGRAKDGTARVYAYPYGFKPVLHSYRLDEPSRWTKPRTIFVCSMADLFGDWVPDSWIEEIFAACDRAPQHRYLFLTKNPYRYMDLDIKKKLPHKGNMWYGVTVANRGEAEKANCYLEDLPRESGAFLSIEPIHEDVAYDLEDTIANFVDWVIIGAETGSRKAKIIPDKKWIDEICKEANMAMVPVFMKDSLLPIMGEENMRREFPWKGTNNGD